MDELSRLNALLTKSRVLTNKKNLHEKLLRWSAPPSQTEIEKCERAERMVKEAISEDPTLSKMKVRVFAKGSYANRTNIPSDSDVDIAVLCEDNFFIEAAPGRNDSDHGFYNTGYNYDQFKEAVAVAIVRKFGALQVKVDDKCIKVRSNTSRVDADVVPHFMHRRFMENGDYIDGVGLYTSDKGRIYNWPQQDYDNGVAKNTQTGKRYKGFVRIIKNLRSEMEDSGIASSSHAKSYLIACLVWNVPNYLFEGDDYGDVLKSILDYLIGMTSNYANVSEWGEVNELKYLFRLSQPWRIEDMNRFLIEARKYVDQLC